MLPLLLLLIHLCTAADQFSAVGNKVMKNGDWVVFNGISLECTEYFLRTNLGPLWGMQHCFGGPSHEGANNIWELSLNQEPANVINMLTTNFKTSNTIKKVTFNSPYNSVIDTSTPKRHPLIRLPTTGSTYLYDADCVTNNATDYVETLDMIIKNFTANGIAVAYDLHWNCPQPSKLGCAYQGPAPFALRYFGSTNPGALAYWDAISKKYASNPYVFYELYNEPFFKPGIDNFNVYYNGSTEFVGVAEMYNVIRKNDPTGMIIISGMQQYAFDAPTQLGFYLKYYEDYGVYPTNVIYNYHPYQAQGQGPEKSVQGALRMVLAGKEIGPVIFTEFGQACCGNNPQKCSNGASGPCKNHNTGDSFTYNIVNLAYQYDISWTGWSWIGTTPYDCNNLRDCYDMRNENGSFVSNGTWGGAPWALIWNDFVNNDSPQVKDVQKDSTSVNVEPTVHEKNGYLPRPCIMGDYNLQAFCGLDLSTDITTVNYTVFATNSIYQSVLPGMPPKGSCKQQGCPTHPCNSSPLCQ
eukprot:281715_1